MLRRLTQRRKLLAAQVAKDAWAKCNGDRDQYESLARADERLVGIDPALIVLIIRLIMAAYEYFASAPKAETPTDEEIVLGAVPFYK